MRQLDMVQAKLDVLDELERRDENTVSDANYSQVRDNYCREYVQAYAVNLENPIIIMIVIILSCQRQIHAFVRCQRQVST